MAREGVRGKDPLTGREIRFRKIRRTEVEAQIELGRLLARSGRNPDSGVTVAELLDAYVPVAGWDVSREEANLGYIRRTIKPLYVWLAAITGVRRGELCGVQLRDIDLENGVLHIAFNYVVKGGKKVRKDTKTHQDKYLAIDPVTCALIREHLAAVAAALRTPA